jgi:hypothetical protein
MFKEIVAKANFQKRFFAAAADRFLLATGNGVI